MTENNSFQPIKQKKPMVSALTLILQAKKSKKEREQIGMANQKKVVFFLDIGQNFGGILKTSVEIDTTLKVRHALQMALLDFQQQCYMKQASLDCSLENFALRLARKNGKPKTDMPAIDLEQDLSSSHINYFSLQIINERVITKRKVTEKNISKQTISTEINFSSRKGSEVMGLQEAYQLRRKDNCFFSFC